MLLSYIKIYSLTFILSTFQGTSFSRRLTGLSSKRDISKDQAICVHIRDIFINRKRNMLNPCGADPVFIRDSVVVNLDESRIKMG